MRFFQTASIYVLSLCLASFALADDERESLWVEVIDAYVEMHSGPGRGYPIFYVIEQGERVDVITRRPDWYEVRTQGGKTGWVSATQISRTMQSTGEPADLPAVSYGDYLKNSWRVGFNTGQFSSGEMEGSETFSFTAGYRPFGWLGAELEAGKVFGTDIKGEIYGLNLLLEPFTNWRVSPIIVVGSGEMKINSQPKLVPLEIEDSRFNHYGLGFNYYLGRNFLFKGEYRSYSVSTDNDNVSLEAWLLGFNTFF